MSRDWDDINALREQVNEYADGMNSLQQRLDAAKRMVERLQRPMDQSGLDAIGLEAARKIEDIFAQGHAGVAQRTAKIQIEIAETIREVLTGTRHWSRGGEQTAI